MGRCRCHVRRKEQYCCGYVLKSLGVLGDEFEQLDRRGWGDQISNV
jgi:hypothetical protein